GSRSDRESEPGRRAAAVRHRPDESQPQQGSDHDDGTRGDWQAADGLTRGRVCEVRAHRQFRDCDGARPRRAADADRERRRADRIAVLLLHRVMTRLALPVSSRQRSTSVAFEARRTLTEPRLQKADYEYAP